MLAKFMNIIKSEVTLIDSLPSSLKSHLSHSNVSSGILQEVRKSQLIPIPPCYLVCDTVLFHYRKTFSTTQNIHL